MFSLEDISGWGVQEKQVKEACKKWSAELRILWDKYKEVKKEWGKQEELISSVNHCL